MRSSAAHQLTTEQILSTPGRGRLLLLQPRLIVAEETAELLSMADLRQFAEHLAKEFGYRQGSAYLQPASWYREQADPAVCSEQTAVLLREMTAEHCRASTAVQSSLDLRRAEMPSPRRATRREGVLNGLALLLILTALIAVGSFLAMHHSDGELDQPAFPIAWSGR